MIAGLLFALHAALLAERALAWESIEATIALRWVLSIGLLLLLRRLQRDGFSFGSPGLGLAAVLAFALIHTPAAAPEPGLPIAATGMGVALSLAAVRGPGRPTASPLAIVARAWELSASDQLTASSEGIKDRAPPSRG